MKKEIDCLPLLSEGLANKMKDENWKVGDVIYHPSGLSLKVIEVRLGEITVAPIKKPKLPICTATQELWMQTGFEKSIVSNVCHFPIVS